MGASCSEMYERRTDSTGDQRRADVASLQQAMNGTGLELPVRMRALYERLSVMDGFDDAAADCALCADLLDERPDEADPEQGEADSAALLADRMKREADVRHKERLRAFDIIDITVRHDNPVAAKALWFAAAKIMGEKP